MKILKIIVKVLLTILKVPFTIWYVVFGFFVLIVSFLEGFGGMKNDAKPETISLVHGLLTFEWASLTKFYHFKW